MSARKLCALTAGLPPDSALRRDGRLWTQQHELAAVAIERAEMWSLHQLAMWADKKSRLPDAIAITHPARPTPDAPPKPKPTTDRAEIERFLSQMRR